MNEYLYVLSNPAMPGLIKIGKTTTSPDQRMAELYSTGVPAPFVLELSLQVEDCHVSERKAHQALIDCRLSSNREFFQTSIAHAIKVILSVIGMYKIHIVRATHGVAEIEKELSLKQRAGEKLKAEKEASARRRTFEEKQKLDARKIEIDRAIKLTDQKIKQLGERPVERKLSGIDTIFLWAYYPLPLGWVVWLNTLQIFSSGREAIGLVCIVLLIVGFLCSSNVESGRKVFNHYNAPFSALCRKREELIYELHSVEKSIAELSIDPSPQSELLGQFGISGRFKRSELEPVGKKNTDAMASYEPRRECKNEFSAKTGETGSKNGLDLPFGFTSIDELTQLAKQDELTRDQLITIRDEAPYLGLRWRDLEVFKEALNRK
jgi:hypothetical protein